LKDKPGVINWNVTVVFNLLVSTAKIWPILKSTKHEAMEQHTAPREGIPERSFNWDSHSIYKI